MDEAKLKALLALRKQLMDGPTNAGTTDLTSPDEYDQMPEDLQQVVARSAVQSSAAHPGYRFGNYTFPARLNGLEAAAHDVDVSQRMAKELQDDIKFQQLQDLLKKR
jgi:hypothetical protein